VKRVALALVVLSACATPSKTAGALDVQARATKALEKFADALAQDGFSVALPPRVCIAGIDDVRIVGSCEWSWRDDVGCLVAPWGLRGDSAGSAGVCECFEDCEDEASMLQAYARALVRARFPSADSKADALVASYLVHDDGKLAATARGIENEFDALRLKKPKSDRIARHEPSRRPEGEGTARAPVSEAVDAGPASERSTARREEPHNAGALEAADAGPGALSTRDKLVGTWTYDGGPIRNIYAMCADGKYEVTFEVVDSSFDFALEDLPTVHGTWVFVDGDPPKITFSAMGETMDAPLIKIDDDDIDVTLDNENLHLTRRSKSASCE
jgi:hypothetical protein